MPRVLSVVGARPQFVKAAPVSHALRQVADEYLVHTGQHYDDEMSAIFFEELGIPTPDLNLGIGSGSHGRQTGRMLEQLDATMREVDPDVVLVYGDTNSTLAGALAAVKLHMPVAHVEAGMRSFRRDMPEEVNRVVADHVADLLLAPTQRAVDNLVAEGITDGVVLVGDVMVDAMLRVKPLLSRERPAALGAPDRYLAATMHRAETVDKRERLEAALSLLGAMPLPVVIPVHPRTQAALATHGVQWPVNVVPLEPVGYPDMLSLVAYSEAVLTDSGGLQKEAALLGKPCLVLRAETEWAELEETGWAVVVDLDVEKALAALAHADDRDPGAVDRLLPPGASEKCADLIVELAS